MTRPGKGKACSHRRASVLKKPLSDSRSQPLRGTTRQQATVVTEERENLGSWVQSLLHVWEKPNCTLQKGEKKRQQGSKGWGNSQLARASKMHNQHHDREHSNHQSFFCPWFLWLGAGKGLRAIEMQRCTPRRDYLTWSRERVGRVCAGIPVPVERAPVSAPGWQPPALHSAGADG